MINSIKSIIKHKSNNVIVDSPTYLYDGYYESRDTISIAKENTKSPFIIISRSH